MVPLVLMMVTLAITATVATMAPTVAYAKPDYGTSFNYGFDDACNHRNVPGPYYNSHKTKIYSPLLDR